MTTIRIPISRPLRGRFSDAALDVFLALRHLIETKPCTCPPVDWEHKWWVQGPPCPACLEYQELHGRLANLWPGVKPWWWPIVERPDKRCPYPEGSGQAKQWKPDEEAQQRWREIAAAVTERERERGAAPPPVA
jgi:hypothetical protein